MTKQILAFLFCFKRELNPYSPLTLALTLRPPIRQKHGARFEQKNFITTDFATFAPTPDMVADFMTKQTQRLTHERHCRRAFGDQHAPIPLEPIVRVLA
jgi:hypothetical protein